MSVNLYQTGVSGLLAAQQQLATTGNNIANVNTEGYSRQRVEQNAANGISFGNNFIGSGTYVQDITRIFDQFAYKEQLLNQGNLGNADSIHIDLSQLNDVMSFSGSAINNSIDRFYQAINGIADNPSDLGLRNIALSQAKTLSSDFNSLNENFDQMKKSTNGEIEKIANQMSKISLEIAKINEQILNQKGVTTAGQPNDLLDKRDNLVSELGQYTRVNAITDANNVMTVMIGSGATLVAGITPLTLRVNAGDPDPMKTELLLVGPNGTVAMNGATLGGSLAAKLEFRDQHLTQVRSEINLLAMSISETINAVQHDGLDLNALEGQDIFTDINTTALQQGRVLAPSNNGGTLQASVNITKVSKVPTNEFEIRYDGTDYLMTNMTDKSVTNLGNPGAGTYATAFGFEFIENSGAPALDDSFVIRPTENSAALMDVTLSSGVGIAASTPIEVSASVNNVGGAKVEITAMIDPVLARASMPIEFNFIENPPGTYTYTYTNNSGFTTAPITYTPPSQGGNIGNFVIKISGNPSGIAPNAPETFVISDAFGKGNGNNTTAMALTQEKSVLNGGRETFSQSLANSTSEVGSKAKSAELVADTAQVLFTQSYNRNQAVSGVNLDEEAANLMKFQQAYQASSRIISIANTIFDTLLQAVR